MVFRLLPIVLAGVVVTGATCVTSFEQQGPSGPWTGEFQHYKSFDANYFEWQASVTDASGRSVGPVTMNICPHAVPAGGTGAFEMSVPSIGGPLHAGSLKIDGYRGGLSFPQAGLTAEVIGLDPPGTATVRIANATTDVAFSDVTVCGIAREPKPSVPFAPGDVIAVSPEVMLEHSLLPGTSAEVNLTFTRQAGIPDLIEIHVAGVPFDIRETLPDGSLIIDTGPFDVTLPPGWTYTPRQGTDSFVGEFSHRRTRVFFDYGWYSGSLGEYENDPGYAVMREKIHGRDATIVTPLFDGPGITGAHIIVLDPVGITPMSTTILLHAADVPPDLRPEVLAIYRSLIFEGTE